MQLPHVFIAFFMCDEAFPHVFIAFWQPQASFWEPIGLSWGLLFSMLEGLWSFLGILWGQNGARNIKMRVSKAILAQVEVARGSQRLSMGRFCEDFHHLLCPIWYFCLCFLVRKVLCMQFGTLTWILDVFAFISAWHFNMVAASHCNCFLNVLGVVKAAPQARPKTT